MGFNSDFHGIGFRDFGFAPAGKANFFLRNGVGNVWFRLLTHTLFCCVWVEMFKDSGNHTF